jgi:hypothetical protein
LVFVVLKRALEIGDAVRLGYLLLMICRYGGIGRHKGLQAEVIKNLYSLFQNTTYI